MNINEIALVGCYGANNFGDDIMLYELLAHIHKEFPHIKVNVVSFYNRGVSVPHQECVQVIRMQGALDKIIEAARLFRRCKYIFFGGGTCFTESGGDGCFKFFLMAKLFGCKFGYLGVGATEMKAPLRRFKMAVLLHLAEFALFREAHSYDLATRIAFSRSDRAKIHLTEDLAYLHFAHPGQLNSSARNIKPSIDLLISWRNLDAYTTPDDSVQAMDSFVAGLKMLHEVYPFRTVSLLVLDETSDPAAHQSLKEKLTAELHWLTDVPLLKNMDFRDKVSCIAKAGLFISFRLHGAFAGKILGVPTMGLNYSPKLRYFFGGLNAGGLFETEDLIHRPSIILEKYLELTASEPVAIDLAGKAREAQKNIEFLTSYLHSMVTSR